MEKIILIIIGIALVGLVLFIGYKMDKVEETKKRRDKFVKNGKKENASKTDEDDAYAMIYDTIKAEIENEEVDANESIFFDENTSDYEENENSEVEKDSLAEPEEIPEEVEEFDEDEELEEDTHEEKEENLHEAKPSKNIQEMIDVFENTDSTMVFNSRELKEENNNNNNFTSVKGYDYEEDDDLSDLENTIKSANIKRYVRNFEAEIAFKEQYKKQRMLEKKSNVKRYTRKINKEEVKPKPVTRRYTRKKQTVSNKSQQIENIEIEENVVEEKPQISKPKRGRPKKSDQPVKPKRGRPRKIDTTKPKRGRPRKTDTSKKGTTKKK